MNAHKSQTTPVKRFLKWYESERVAMSVSSIYWSAAALWILLSDSLVHAIFNDPEPTMRAEIFKGWLFVTVTAAILFMVLRKKFMRSELEIAARKKAEEAVRGSEKRFAAIVGSAMDAVITADEEQRITLFNSAAEKIFGYGAAEIIGRPLDTLIPERFLAAHAGHVRVFSQSYKTRRAMGESGNIFGCRATGEEFPIEASISQINVAGKKFFSIILRDITERKRAEEALRESLALNQAVMQTIPFVVDIVDQNGNLLFVSPKLEAIAGKNWRGQKCWDVYKDDQKQCSHCPLYRDIISGESSIVETEGVLGGKTFQINHTGMEFQGKPAVLEIFQNITERKRAEQQLRKLSRAVEQSPASIVITNTAGEIEYVNQKFIQLTGYTLDEMRGRNPNVLKSGETPSEEYRNLWQTIGAGKEWRGEFHNRKKNGELYWELASIMPIVDDAGKITHFLAVKEDITERKAAEERIKSSLKEKDVLLKEIHHRVKNNLQVISSLLKLQSRYTKDTRVIELFEESQLRVKSMALIHEELYKSANLARIKFASYVKSIADHLLRSYGQRSNAVTLKVDVDDVQLDIDRAVPCGLIINELVTNSLKYAFPPERTAQRGRGENKITIEMRLRGGGQVALKISDNGVGLPEGLDFRNSDSLGLQLVNTLTDQLRGDITCNTAEGTEFEITFVAGNGSAK